MLGSKRVGWGAIVGLLIVLVVIVARVTTVPVFAFPPPPPAPTVSPTSPVAGQTFTISGSFPGTSGDSMSIQVFHDTSAAHDCSSVSNPAVFVSSFIPLTASLTYSGPVVIATAGFYCAAALDETISPPEPTLSDPFSVTAATIPEYPIGLPLLAIFMVITYGLIRRKTTITKQK